MSSELQKRIITSIFLLSLLTLMFMYTFILIVSLMILGTIVWIEFYALISKILPKKDFKHRVLRFLFKAISLIYLTLLVYLVIVIKLKSPELQMIVVYSILISIMTDVGGLVTGKAFKGKKLTKISPKKTISGSIGSFIFSFFLIPIFIKYLPSYDFFSLLIITLIISLVSQFGDLLISFIKRKAKVKDTSDLLPGHGGVLDRVDGIIFAIPTGFLIFTYL